MRIAVSSSVIGFVVLTASSIALAGCSFSATADAEAAAEVGAAAPSASEQDRGSRPEQTVGVAIPATSIETIGGPAALPGVPTAIGQGCTSGAECKSGSCADGVCCDIACDGVCESCNSPGQVGSCVPHTTGTDPERECGTAACYAGYAETFSCDGAGACQVEIGSCESE